MDLFLSSKLPLITSWKERGSQASGYQGSGPRSVVIWLCDILDDSFHLPGRDGGEKEYMAPSFLPCPSLTLPLVTLERTMCLYPGLAPTLRLSSKTRRDTGERLPPCSQEGFLLKMQV